MSVGAVAAVTATQPVAGLGTVQRPEATGGAEFAGVLGHQRRPSRRRASAWGAWCS